MSQIYIMVIGKKIADSVTDLYHGDGRKHLIKVVVGTLYALIHVECPNCFK